MCVKKTAANTVYLHTNLQNLRSQIIDNWPIFQDKQSLQFLWPI